MSRKSVAIDCLAESLHHYGEGCAVVVVDVIRSITVAATVVESGRRCFFAPSVEAALLLAKQLDNPLLVGEMGGGMPYGFDVNNSPVEIESRRDISRPAIIVSSSGIPLLCSLRTAIQFMLRVFGITGRQSIISLDITVMWWFLVRLRVGSFGRRISCVVPGLRLV